ncbi:hypothetical protein ILUMI_17620, partial [Ignelater luminosus]
NPTEKNEELPEVTQQDRVEIPLTTPAEVKKEIRTNISSKKNPGLPHSWVGTSKMIREDTGSGENESESEGEKIESIPQSSVAHAEPSYVENIAEIENVWDNDLRKCVVADESYDIAGKEQLSIGIRFYGKGGNKKNFSE